MFILQSNLKAIFILWVVFSTVVSYAKRCCDQDCKSKYTFHLVRCAFFVVIRYRALIRICVMLDLQPQVML